MATLLEPPPSLSRRERRFSVQSETIAQQAFNQSKLEKQSCPVLSPLMQITCALSSRILVLRNTRPVVSQVQSATNVWTGCSCPLGALVNAMHRLVGSRRCIRLTVSFSCWYVYLPRRPTKGTRFLFDDQDSLLYS